MTAEDCSIHFHFYGGIGDGVVCYAHAQVANNFSEDRFSVIYKRPTDLALLKDVPICCNILICDMFDEGAPFTEAFPWHST